MASSPSAPSADREWDLILIRHANGGAPGTTQVRMNLADKSAETITFTSAEAASMFLRELSLALAQLHFAAVAGGAGSERTQDALAAMAARFRLPTPDTSILDQQVAEQQQRANRELPSPRLACPDGRELHVSRLRTCQGPDNLHRVRVVLDDDTEQIFTFDTAADGKAFTERLHLARHDLYLSRLPPQRLWRPSNPETIVDVVSVAGGGERAFTTYLRRADCKTDGE